MVCKAPAGQRFYTEAHSNIDFQQTVVLEPTAANATPRPAAELPSTHSAAVPSDPPARATRTLKDSEKSFSFRISSNPVRFRSPPRFHSTSFLTVPSPGMCFTQLIMTSSSLFKRSHKVIKVLRSLSGVSGSGEALRGAGSEDNS